MNKAKIITSILLLIIFNSCFFRSTIMKTETVKEIGTQIDYIDKLKTATNNYKSLKIEFESEIISGEENNTLYGTMKIRKDSAVWISLSPGLGIEAARVLITNDSLKFINRLTQEFYAGSYSDLYDLYGISGTYSTIQALLTNALLENNTYNLYEIDNRNTSDSNTVKLISKTNDYTQIIHADTLKLTLNENRFISPKNDSIICKIFYTNKLLNIPERVEYEIIGTRNRRIVNLSINEYEKDNSLNFAFKIPKKYSQIELKKKDENKN